MSSAKPEQSNLPSKIKRFLYVGDIVGQTGLALIERQLPELKRRYKVDCVIAQAENVSNGRGTTPADFRRLLRAGVDFCTGGNWSLWEKDITPSLNDPHQPIIRPANHIQGTPGLGWKYLDMPFGKILVVSLLGQIVGRDSKLKMENPLVTIDRILEETDNQQLVARVVNFHGDYSSEKVVIGFYLDGRVSAVIGDHWHVPTADARVLPKGTAHVTDVGMVGALNSSLGVKADLIIDRWRNDTKNHNILEIRKPWQFNALMFDVDTATGLSLRAKAVQELFT